MFAHRIWTGKMCVLKVTFQVAESAVIACLVVILFNKKDNSSERGAVGLLLSSGAGSGYQSTAAGATGRPEIDICRRLGTRLTTYWPVFARLYHVTSTRSSAIADGLRDTSCQLKPCQLPRNSAETTCTTTSLESAVANLPVRQNRAVDSARRSVR